jgi:hypothetical protein
MTEQVQQDRAVFMQKRTSAFIVGPRSCLSRLPGFVLRTCSHVHCCRQLLVCMLIPLPGTSLPSPRLKRVWGNV